MKNKLKNWNLFEIIFLAVSIAIIVTVFVFNSEKNWLSFICSIIGITAVMCLAKGLVITPYLLVVNGCLYSILSYTQAYYGEMIVYIGLMIPMAISSIISWNKNKNKEDGTQVSVNKIKKSEYVYLALATIVASIAFYFLLKAFNTNQLIISTLALITSTVASYLLFRRSSYYAIGYIINDIILIVLWSTSVSTFGVEYLPTVICFAIFLINDIYGLIHWKMEEKKQSQQKIDAQSE